MEITESVFIYKIGGLKRPGFNRLQRKVLYLNKIPLIRKLRFVRKWILKIYNIPSTRYIFYRAVQF